MPSQRVSRFQQCVNQGKHQQPKYQDLTNQAKFQLYKDKFPLNGSKTSLNALGAVRRDSFVKFG